MFMALPMCNRQTRSRIVKFWALLLMILHVHTSINGTAGEANGFWGEAGGLGEKLPPPPHWIEPCNLTGLSALAKLRTFNGLATGRFSERVK